MIISVCAEKMDKTKHLLFISFLKNVSITRIEEIFISLVKGICRKFTGSIIVNGKVMKTFHLKSIMTKDIPLPLLLFNIVFNI